MKKILSTQRKIGLISFAIEIVILILLFYFVLTYPNENWTQALFVIFLDLVILYNFLLQLIFNIVLNNKKSLIELSVIELLGINENETRIFDSLGIIITNRDFIVTWVNSYITNNYSSIIDKSIFDVFPDVKVLTTPSEENLKTINIVSENHNYQVEYLADSNMFILKDITDLVNLTNLNEGNSPVIGYLNIDNYDDIFQSSSDDTKFSEIFYSTRLQINQYFNKKGALIRRLKEDRYMFIMTKNAFNSILDDNFKIIEDVRNNQSGFTLSIGVGYGFPEYSKISELAASASDIAMARGGDQAVIHPAKENFIYIGGKSELKSSRNKVKMRSFGDSLLATINSYRKIFIMGHSNADFDAIGSSLGAYILCKATNDASDKNIKIAFEPAFVEAKCRKAVEVEFSKEEMDELFLNSKTVNTFFDDNTLLILVDHNASHMSMFPQISARAKHTIIIDHHRPDQKIVSDPIFKNIDTSASSASELITEFIYYTKKEIEIPSRTATFLLSGIMLDTRSFKNNASASTYEAASILKEYGANSSKAIEFMKEDWAEFKQKISILNGATTPFPGVLVIENKDDEIISDTMLAIAATEAAQISEISAVFCIGRISEHSVKISARSNGNVNCQMLLEKMGGGGHFSMAACVVNEVSVQDVAKRLNDILSDYLEEATVKVIEQVKENNA